MTNPFQHGSSSFAGDAISATGQRRSSYASVVSGAATLSRPSRSGGSFFNILNPSSDSDPRSNSYAHNRNLRFDLDLGMPQVRDGTPVGDGASGIACPPRLGANLPWFSRAWDMHMNKDLPFTGGLSDDGFGNLVPSEGGTTFLSPSYLRGTVYLQKLEEAHKARVATERDSHVAKTQTGSGLTGGGTGHTQGPKLPGGSHRGVAYELVEKPLLQDDEVPVSPLPSKWSQEDKESSLEVFGDGYEVKYTGRGSSDHEACAIRADHSMPTLCGVYYFEITILNKRMADTTIGIGFSSRTVSLQRAPGWEPESWGYHGDDGHCFAAQNAGKPYGPKFGPSDTVGCLINFRLGQVLFTKNGDDLGIAFKDVNFKDVKGKLFPTVGLKKPGDHILVNFGQIPFQFDIDGYMKKQQEQVDEEIRNADTSKLAPPLKGTGLIQQLVLQFLQHDGYVETARAFAEEVHAEKEALNLNPDEPIEGINIKDDEDANNRQCIRRAILNGDIDRALKYTKKHYPTVLRENEQVYFHLRCRKFIEMIRKEAELNLELENKRKRRSVYLEDDEEMLEAGGDSTWEDQMDTEDAIDNAGVSKLSQEALAYGIELRSEFNADPQILKQLEEIFALMAYPNPLKVKEVAHLLDETGRAAVAEELNSAILMSLGKSSRAALENLYAQTTVLIDMLRRDGGDGAFVTVQGVVESIPKRPSPSMDKLYSSGP